MGEPATAKVSLEQKRGALRALACLDLTNLNADCDAAAIAKLCADAATPFGPVAAVCVYPPYVAQSKALLNSSGIKVATVANFPAGENDTRGAVKTTVVAFANGADEVDVVFPYKALIGGNAKAGDKLVAACRAVVPRGKRLKVIIESGELKTDALIAQAAAIALDAGAHFIKTSTGKTAESATPKAAYLMLSEIRSRKGKAGFKASGGIRTAADAALYLAIADGVMGAEWVSPSTFRFGASGLLTDLLGVLSGGGPQAAKGGY